ncbi:MAG TPA: hypothetical protein VEZ11_07935 [Thermoanaerobaculia bacterium]|nr:hypothetical protein [Thermoanaerobaculia bacterium]
MPTNIRVIRASDFIKATPEGRLDFRESRELLAEIASASADLREHEIILDTRTAQIEMSVADLWYLAAELSDLRKAFFGKTAVLCPLEQFDRAGFFALCAQNRGFRVRAFTLFEEAIEWLVSSAM